MSTSIIPHIGSPFFLKNEPRVKMEVQKVKISSWRTSSHDDFPAIIGISTVLLAVVMIETVFLMIYTVPVPTGECRKMILGFEHRGFYTSQDQFKTAMSYCYVA